MVFVKAIKKGSLGCLSSFDQLQRLNKQSLLI